MKNLHLIFVNFIFIIGLLFLYGCFVTGPVVGTIIDEPKQKGTFMQSELERVNSGNKVIVYTTNDQQVEGTYNGKVLLSKKDYYEKYSYFLESNSELNMPALGDSVKIENDQLFSGRLINTKFRGLDKNCFYVHGLEILTFSEVPYNSNPKLIDQAKSKIDFLSLMALIKENKVPYLSAAHIKLANNKQVYIPFNEILKVEMNNSHESAMYGFFIGLGVDIVVILSIIASGVLYSGIGS